MFTGLVQKVGTVKRISRSPGLVVEIAFDPWLQPLAPGESVAVNGVCLTVVDCDRTRFTADVLTETEACSTIGGMAPGMKVNLERALRAGDPLGGHIVQGHVDGVGVVVAKSEERGGRWKLRVRCGRVLAAQMALKGSVAVDGVSLTVNLVGDDYFGVDIIPTTAHETTLGMKRVGDKVNIEGDVMGKYVAKHSTTAAGITEASLLAAGFIDCV